MAEHDESAAVSYVVAHTAIVPADHLRCARRLMDVVFDGEFADDDWEHALGGMHVLTFVGDELIGHAAVVQRRLISGDRSWRTGYVEAVGVHADWQRRGIGGELMERVEVIVDAAYELGALGTSDAAMTMYTARGWVPWRGRLQAMTPTGIVATPDEEGAVYVRQVAGHDVDLDAELTCDWRGGDVW